MSTKIYNAFRVRSGVDAWATLLGIRQRGEREVRDRLEKYYRGAIESIDPDDPRYREARAKNPGISDLHLRLNLVSDQVRNGYRIAVTSMQRDEYDLDVLVAVTQHTTGYYLRAFCDHASIVQGSLDFLREHPDLEDFHYQNQSDPPLPVSEEEWAERARIWDEMMDSSGYFKCQLVLEISTWSGFWMLDPWLDLLRELTHSPPVIPCREEIEARRLRATQSFESVTAEPGQIIAATKDGQLITIEQAKKRSQRGQWVTRMNGKLKRHASLGRATGHVQLQTNPDLRRWVERWQCEAKMRRKRPPR